MTETGPDRRFILPADYYASASPAAVLPSWVTFGCGGLSLLVLAVVFAGGVWLSGGGIVDLMDLGLGLSRAELGPLYAADVTPAQKSALETEIDTLRKNLRDGKVRPQQISLVLDAMRRATGDGTVSSRDAGAILDAARRLNAEASAPRPLPRRSAPSS
jgi:hypothetical protein